MKQTYIFASLLVVAIFSYFYAQNSITNANETQINTIQKSKELESIARLKKRFDSQSPKPLRALVEKKELSSNLKNIAFSKKKLSVALENLNEKDLGIITKELIQKDYKIQKLQIKRVNEKAANLSFEVLF